MKNRMVDAYWMRDDDVVGEPRTCDSWDSDFKLEINVDRMEEDEGVSAVKRQSDLKDVALRLRVMLDEEEKCLPSADYAITVQNNPNAVDWRNKLVLWLLEFEEEFGLSQETVAVAVNFMDRFLSEHAVPMPKLQLLAIAAVFTASKLNETVPMQMQELCVLAEEAYTKEEITDMELDLLHTMQWKLNPTTAQALLNHLLEFVECPHERAALYEDAITFLDVVTPEYDFLEFKPSVHAYAAVIFAFETTNLSPCDWYSRLSEFGVFANLDCVFQSPEVASCMQRMRIIMHEMCPSMLAKARSSMVVSPVGVADLIDQLEDSDGEGPVAFGPGQTRC